MQSTAPALDRALAHVLNLPPEVGPGYANHVPMVLETLDRLGYRDDLEKHAIRGRDFILANPCERQLFLQPSVFHEALAEREWQQVLAAWLPRLAPGMAGGAAHGLIRTAHAVRAVERIPTPTRIGELADAITYWEAAWCTLPGEPCGPGGPFSPEDAIRLIPLCNPTSMPKGSSLIIDQLVNLERFAGFKPVIDMVITDVDPETTLDELTHLSARLLLANFDRAPVAFLHGFTACNSARVLMPYLAHDLEGIFLRYLWQLVAGLYSWYGAHPPAAHDSSSLHLDAQLDHSSPRALAHLIENSVQAGGNHAIKATAACVEEFRRSHDSVFLTIPPAMLAAGLGEV